MRNFIFPLKDTTIYSELPSRNTGLDEQLEIGKSLYGTKSIRSLIQFSTADLTNGIPPQATYDLVLYVSYAEKLKDVQVIEACPVNQSWNDGTGYFYQDIVQVNDGATWTSNDSGSLWAVTGSSFTTALTSSVVCPNPMGDLVLDVTQNVRAWISGSANNGLVLKFTDISEQDSTNNGVIRIFSNETHTIYRPVLVAKWNDQTFNTGSLDAAPIAGLVVTPAVKPVYYIGETVRVDLACRAQYPLKTFANATTAYAGLKYLPSSSYFSIIDDQANTTVIPFGDSSLVSCDENGSYIIFPVQNMYQRRFYRLLIKVVANGLSQIFDTAAIFTVK